MNLCWLVAVGVALSAGSEFQVDWGSFLGRADMISLWSRNSTHSPWTPPGPPLSYNLASFVGNGNLGGMIQATDDGSLAIVIGRTDAYDRRIPGTEFATGELLCDVARLPIGNLTLEPVGRVLSARARVRLWDGEVMVQLNTTVGRLDMRVLVFAGGSAPSAGASGILLVETNATEGETAKWRFAAGNASANAVHPVYKTESYACTCDEYKQNPQPQHSMVKGLLTVEQPLLVGDSWASALGKSGGLTVLATSAPSPAGSLQAAVEDVRWALAARDQLVSEHREEWHRFYQAGGFVSVNHPRVEQLYWITQYKVGSGMGLRGDLMGDGGLMDHTAPWFLPNNGLFNWDLNIQMSWWGVAQANRVPLVVPLLRFVEKHVVDLCENVLGASGCSNTSWDMLAGPSAHTGYVAVGRIQVGHGTPVSLNNSIQPPGPLGDLVWLLSNVHGAYRATRNRTIAERLYPLLAGAANHYVLWLAPDSDGVFHLPPTFSPEYTGGLGTGDTSYELALCRWGLAAVLELGTELGVKDPMAGSWAHRLARLANYSVDPQFGLNVARGLAFEQPHRHFSHLMGGVLRDPTLRTLQGQVLLLKSVTHWRGLRDPCAFPLPRAPTRSQGPIKDAGWTGFSYAASALIHARLHRSQEAVADVCWMAEHSAVEGKVGHREPGSIPASGACPVSTILNGSTLHVNTFYAEGVGDPTGETPFGTAAALQELLVGESLTYNERVVVFPGLGSSTQIQSACFHNMRVPGAFLVSGCFRNSSTQFVSVLSEAGRRCVLQVESMRQPLAVNPPVTRMNVSGSVVELQLGAGESATVYTKGTPVQQLTIQPMPIHPGEENFWGLKLPHV